LGRADRNRAGTGTGAGARAGTGTGARAGTGAGAGPGTGGGSCPGTRTAIDLWSRASSRGGCMSYYRDHRNTITPTQIRIRGVPFAWISSIIFEKEDIAAIEFTGNGIRNRLMMNGPTSRDTWSCYDPFSLFRGKAVVITLTESIAGFKRLTLTFSDGDAAMQVLKDEYAEFLTNA
ncbi:MAG: hypothetical protein VX938_10610, partial [Myxococcota bacterium]|nr:hypothetical protein [Myxococcota bacterium]